MTSLDPERWRLALAALAGSAVYGLYHLGALVIAGAHPSRGDYLRAALNIVSAVVVGVLVAWFLGRAVLSLMPAEGLRDPSAAGFLIGAASWEVLPILLSRLKALASKLNLFGGPAKPGEGGAS
jgi:hypothetical protein